MRYALLIYASEQDWASQSEEQAQAQFQEYMSFTKDIVDRGIMLAIPLLKESDLPGRGRCSKYR